MKPRSGPLPALLAASTLLAAGCGRDAPAPVTPAPAPVRVATVATALPADGLRAIGYVAPAFEVRLAFKHSGIVRALHAAPGERVRRGQLLASQADDELAAALAQARARADQAARDHERGQSLLADEVATREQVENLATALAVAEAALRAAEFNARHASIEAPADGLVLQQLAEPGELVAAGQPVLIVGSTAAGWIVRAALPDRDVVRVAIGMAATVALDALPDQEFSATVTEIAAAADPATGTYAIELALAGDTARLVQGLVARVTLAGPQSEPVPVVPVTALLEAGGGVATVFVVSAGDAIARRVPIRLGRLLGEQVEVRDGLRPGERVVTEGAAWLNDGARVRVLDGS